MAESKNLKDRIDPASVSPGDLTTDETLYQLWRVAYSIRGMVAAWWALTIIGVVAYIFVLASDS